MCSPAAVTRSFDMQLAMIRHQQIEVFQTEKKRTLENERTRKIPLRATEKAKREEKEKKLLIKSIKNTSITILIRILAPNQDSIRGFFFEVKLFARMKFMIFLYLCSIDFKF